MGVSNLVRFYRFYEGAFVFVKENDIYYESKSYKLKFLGKLVVQQLHVVGDHVFKTHHITFIFPIYSAYM